MVSYRKYKQNQEIILTLTTSPKSLFLPYTLNSWNIIFLFRLCVSFALCKDIQLEQYILLQSGSRVVCCCVCRVHYPLLLMLQFFLANLTFLSRKILPDTWIPQYNIDQVQQWGYNFIICKININSFSMESTDRVKVEK